MQSLVKEICNYKQWFTQMGGVRPYGVSLLFAGIDLDDETKLFLTDPTGIFFEYRAIAIGEGETEIKEILEKEYKESITVEEGIKLSLRALKKFLGNDFDVERIDGSYIKKSDKLFVRLNKDYLKKIMKNG